MDISNKSACLVGLFVSFGAIGLEASGINVAGVPIIIFSVIGIVFVFINNRSKSKEKVEHSTVNSNIASDDFPKPDWLNGKDLMFMYNQSPQLLMQHIFKGLLPAYPHDTDIYNLGDYAEPLGQDEIDFLLSAGDGLEYGLGELWFKMTDIEELTKATQPPSHGPQNTGG